MGKGKVLKTTFSLLGKLDPSVQRSFSKALKTSKDSGKGMSKHMKDAGASMTSSVKGFAKKAIAAFAGISAAAKLKEFAQTCITEAKEAIDVETKLAALMQNVTSIQTRGPTAAAEATQRLIRVGDQLERIGVVAGDVMVSGFQQLASFQLNDDEIVKLAGGMADLLAQTKGVNASQSDAVSVANMMGKALNGNVGALTKVGILFDENQEKVLKMGSAEERVAMLAEVLKQNVGGVNKALVETDAGKMVNADNLVGAVRDEIGRRLLPIIANFAVKAMPIMENVFGKVLAIADKVSPRLQSLTSSVMPVFEKAFDAVCRSSPQLLTFVKSLYTTVKPLISQFSSLVSRFLPQIVGILKQIGSQANGILPAIRCVVDLICRYIPIVVALIGACYSAIKPVLTALRQVAVALIPKIIGLLQSLAPLLQNLMPAIRMIGTVVGTVIGFLLRLIGGFVGACVTRVTQLVDGLNNVLNFVRYVFTDGWRDAWEGIRTVFTSVWDTMKNVARSALSAVISPINNIISGINGVSAVVGIKAIPEIQLPQFAKGATITRPTVAVVGEGGDPETIVPHNNKPRSRRLLASAAAGVGMKLGGDTYTYAPVIYARDTKGVREALDDGFERFKEYMDRYRSNKDREVFA